jgi:hypothetical protein
VPVSRWAGLGPNDAARVATISQEPLYGPFAANRSERLVEGTSYYFIPVCNGTIRADRKRQDVVSRGRSTSVEC